LGQTSCLPDVLSSPTMGYIRKLSVVSAEGNLILASAMFRMQHIGV